MIKYLFTFLVVTLFFNIAFSQEKYSRVKIFGSHNELQHLGQMGLPIDHGEYKQNTYFITDLSTSDISKVQTAGYTYEILIDDVQKYYVQHSNDIVETESVCSAPAGSDANPYTPDNFQLGTMAGFYTYQEFLDELDSMSSKYPNLISSRDQIGTYTTYEGNPIYWVRLSDNPNTDESEEEVLYTSLHHAREPASLSQTIFYMWYLLENYGSNPEITYLVDNTEMYFVPMVNPDGYLDNVTNFPNGGGMHRKNTNPVSGGSNNIGVDLNRNYGYNWNQSGTSNDPNNDTWPGTAPFSEVETQAMKWFVENHEFKFASNAHTHGNLLLYPIGWSSSEIAPHASYFDAFTSHMVEINGYNNIKASGLYAASGTSDDWMYIDDIGVNGKDTVFAITPEVSSQGSNNDFWPSASVIEKICKGNMHMNKTMAHLPHIYGITEDLEQERINATSGSFNYSLQRLGLKDGPITINMSTIAGIQSIGTGNSHTLNLTEKIEDSIQYTLNSGIQFGDDIIYILEMDNGTFTFRDTIYKKFGYGTTVLFDEGTNADNWTGSWSYTDEDFVSPNSCITDSPYADYYNSNSSECKLIQSFDLSNATYAYVNFWAKWNIETNYDYTQFMISTDGGNSWLPLCGNYTNWGGAYQDQDEPLYDGFQNEWVFEEIDLTDYLGSQSIMFKFRMVSDSYVTSDGFYFDDFSVYTDGGVSSIQEISDLKIVLYPNPSRNILHIQTNDYNLIDEVKITNQLGQVVNTIQLKSISTKLNTGEFAEGIYFLDVISTDGDHIKKKFVVVR